jgi:YD repeat-containing protein
MEEYGYDSAGYMARIVRAGDSALDVVCDADERPSRVTATDGAVAEYERDRAGRLVAARNAEVTRVFTDLPDR